MPLAARSTAGQHGFTLLELMIVVSILAILASIGVPQYVAALRTARVGKAKHELRTISSAVDAFTATNGGQLPLTLYQVGFGGKRDPWGVPYCFLNYTDGTGDGLDWAIDAGLVDPSAFASIAGGAAGGDGGAARQKPDLAVPLAQSADAATRTSPADDRFRVVNYDRLTGRLDRNLTLRERVAIEAAVAERGDFSIFTGVSTEQTRRRDRYMFPLNTDYDLFSLGPDKATATSLGESMGLDDVIRANNGGYFGSASEY